MREQKQLLLLKKERLERLIAVIDRAVKGENVMNAFDNETMKTYAAEAKERWGDTAEYGEFAARSAEQKEKAAEGLDALFAEFAACKSGGETADSKRAQQLAEALQSYITKHFYTCSDEVLCSLGQMYVGDERFKDNIDRHGDGTAAFVAAAIQARFAE